MIENLGSGSGLSWSELQCISPLFLLRGFDLLECWEAEEKVRAQEKGSGQWSVVRGFEEAPDTSVLIAHKSDELVFHLDHFAWEAGGVKGGYENELAGVSGRKGFG